MHHGLELIIPVLEILRIEASHILYYPGNIGNHIFLFSHILEIQAAGGRLQGSGFRGLGLFLEYVPGISGYPGNIGNMTFMYLCDICKKDTRRNFTQNPPTNEPRSLL